jgi:microcystin degradation protein MlrC
VEALKKAGCELVPALMARAVPNGVVSHSLYEELRDEFILSIREALAVGPIDGICLALHGSMKVENLGCAEGDLLAHIRKILPDIPCTASLDMHATVTKEMLNAVNGFVGYKTAPHIDCTETGAHAAAMLLTSLKTGKKLYTAYRRIPMLIAGEKSESEAEPMSSLIELCRKAEKQPGILAASFLLGFPWADDEHNAACALVTGFSENEAAAGTIAEAAENLAAQFWKRRREFAFRSEYYESAAAMEAAYRAVLESHEKPVFVSDSGDNPTAGAAGDSTDLLEKILARLDMVEKLPTPLLYSGFYDAPATAACVKAGIGAVVDTTLGGNWDTLNGKKIPLRLEVRNIVRNFGPHKSDLVLAASGNILFTITSAHIGFGDEDLLPSLGVKAEDYSLVVVKLGYLEPCFRTIARRAILATSKGCSNEVLESIPYKRVTRPLYPLDEDAEL